MFWCVFSDNSFHCSIVFHTLCFSFVIFWFVSCSLQYELCKFAFCGTEGLSYFTNLGLTSELSSLPQSSSSKHFTKEKWLLQNDQRELYFFFTRENGETVELRDFMIWLTAGWSYQLVSLMEMLHLVDKGRTVLVLGWRTFSVDVNERMGYTDVTVSSCN